MTASKLAIEGVYCTLTVDPMSNEVVDLYIDGTELWKQLIDRFGGNKMTVCLRGPHDYRRGMRMPPEMVMRKLDEWITKDGTLDAIIEFIEEVTE